MVNIDSTVDYSLLRFVQLRQPVEFAVIAVETTATRLGRLLE